MDTARASNRRRATAVCAVVLASWMVAGCTDDTAWLESRAGHDPAPPAQVEGAVEEADEAPDLPAASAGDQPDEQPEEPAAPAPFEDAAAALGSYVAAISSGELDTALALRCDDAQPSAEGLERFALEAGQLVGELGPLEVQYVEPAVSQGVDVVRFTLRGHDGWLEVHATMAPEGAVQLCGFRPTASYLVEGALVAAPDLGTTAATPEALLPAEVAGLEQLGSEPVESEQMESMSDPESALRGSDERWSASWADPTYGGLRVDVARFSDADLAAAAAERLLAERALDGVSTFDAGLGTSTGVRALAMAWLWVQPPSVAPYLDSTVLRFGDTVVVVGASGMDPERQLALVRDASARVIALAQG